MIFDINMEDFRHKARLVSSGHVSKTQATIIYASAVSRETVRVAVTVYDLQVRTEDIQNSYIQEPVTEKIWTVLGPEFGPDAGKSAVVARALYGIKSTGASLWNHLADFMKHIEYMSCPVDPDLWMKPMVRPSDGSEYYAYILLYFNGILCIHHDTESFLQKLISILS